jgi:peptidoglycan/xylan/chitin deacetylase (PgdA/CDA1 family)
MNAPFTLLFHEILKDGIDNSGFQRSSAKSYKHDINLFKQYLELIQSSNRSVVLPRQNYSNEIILTFDDGGISNVLASDLLDKQGYKGLFFISTKFIDQPFFLRRQDIKLLRKNGHMIGSHSHSHPNIFRELSRSKMLQEWRDSKIILEDLLGEQITSCSIPGGDSSPMVYETAHECGYSNIFDSEPILGFRNFEDARIYGRFCPKNSVPAIKVEKWLSSEGIMRELLLRKLKNLLKKGASPLYKFKRSFDKHKI